jgi:hypothetical protein
MRRQSTIAIGICLGTAAAGLVGCKQPIERGTGRGPTSFRVEVVEGNVGEQDEPLTFAAQIDFVLDITATDHKGQVADWFDGEVHLDVNPVGELADGMSEWVTIEAGKAENVPVSIAGVHGPAAIWVEDKGELDKPGSYATGASPRLFVGDPLLADLQVTDNHRVSPLAGDFVDVELAGREVVVTAVTNDGFYISDKGAPDYGGLFVFTHSRARGVETGDRVIQLAGTAEDFFGFTELAFPSWQTSGKLPLPQPIVITPQMTADDAAMERLESGFVEIRNARVCQPGADFASFGQWSAIVDDTGNCDTLEGAITIVSSFTVEWLDPNEHVGKTISRITGNLRYHSSAEPAWILRPRDNDDVEL